ncbi:TraB/GumN family protein [Burkholderia gladioli]|uniref:TraB/GumN family protein n=1 Tax=Burkholderia gladioli TaxID=28095 RepID=UPI0016414DF3|nr:TraB/GumN family protein [Burkholderia gladioli]
MKWLARLAIAASMFSGCTMLAIAEITAGVPALKVIAPTGATSILIASMHVPYTGLHQPLASVLRGKSRLVIESSTTDGPQPAPADPTEILTPEALSSLLTGGALPRASWAASLTDDDVAVLRRNATCSGSVFDDKSLDILLAMKSPAMAAGIANLPCGRVGQLSRDEILTRAAKDARLPIDILETQVAVDRQRKAVPDRIYEAQLRGAFGPTAERAFAQVVTALNQGDYATVLRVVNAGYQNPGDAATFYRLMVDERNRAWMVPLHRYLDEGNAVVLVGAAHLPGAGGLISLLTKAGYRIEPIVLPADPTQG